MSLDLRLYYGDEFSINLVARGRRAVSKRQMDKRINMAMRTLSQAYALPHIRTYFLRTYIVYYKEFRNERGIRNAAALWEFATSRVTSPTYATSNSFAGASNGGEHSRGLWFIAGERHKKARPIVGVGLMALLIFTPIIPFDRLQQRAEKGLC